MEGIDHIDVVKIGGCRLIGQVHRMLQRDVPDGEGFKLRVSGADPSLVFVIELGKAGGHFAASGSGSSYHDKRSGGLDIFISSVSLVADDQRRIAGIAGNAVMKENADTQFFQSRAEAVCAFLAGVAGNAYAANIKAPFGKGVNKAEYIHIVCDAQISAHFIFVNISRTDDNDDLRLVAELHQHTQLAVRLEAGKNSGGVVVVK